MGIFNSRGGGIPEQERRVHGEWLPAKEGEGRADRERREEERHDQSSLDHELQEKWERIQIVKESIKGLEEDIPGYSQAAVEAEHECKRLSDLKDETTRRLNTKRYKEDIKHLEPLVKEHEDILNARAKKRENTFILFRPFVGDGYPTNKDLRTKLTELKQRLDNARIGLEQIESVDILKIIDEYNLALERKNEAQRILKNMFDTVARLRDELSNLQQNSNQ